MDSSELTGEQIGDLRKLVTNYFGADMLDRVLDGRADLAGAGKNLTATILIFDLRNSTGISEKIGPENFSGFLSEIFTDIMDLIYGHQGVVNKLLGDGVLATFGVPEARGDDVYNAALCALQIRDYLNTFNDVLPQLITRIGMSKKRFNSG